MPGIKDEHIVTNLLVCRIKRNIDVNRSTRQFLSMVRPKLKLLARHAIKNTKIDMEIALADLESATIESLQHHWIMGERGYPLHYLFSPIKGSIHFYANNYAKKTKKYNEETVLCPDGTKALGWPVVKDEPLTSMDEDSQTDETTRAREVIQDGITLTASEFRVLSFCLANATKARRPLNGLHLYLARCFGVVRARATKIYADAAQKVAQAVHESLDEELD